MNTYKYERCATLEQVSALTASYAAQGLVPGGPPTKLGKEYAIAFVDRIAGRNKAFNTTRGWYSENPLYSLGKVGIGMTSEEPKKRVVTQATIDRQHKRSQLAHAKFLQDYADYLQTPAK
jgi:hypothetical protein